MNYRHAFHAGNFADVFKHVILTRILLYLQRKPAPFRYIDTHAGEGIYDLRHPMAARSGEWRAGIGRLIDVTTRAPLDLLQPYLDIVGPHSLDGAPRCYPGSPRIAQMLMRPQDRALLYELHPSAFQSLAQNFKLDRRFNCVALDGWMGLNACLPPPERRGVVLVDPPFERADELRTMARAYSSAQRKWPTGIYVLWRPIKQPAADAAFLQEMRALTRAPALDLQLSLFRRSVAPPDGLTRTGVTIFNPPYVLLEEARAFAPMLAQALSLDGVGDFAIESFAPTRARDA